MNNTYRCGEIFNLFTTHLRVYSTDPQDLNNNLIFPVKFVAIYENFHELPFGAHERQRPARSVRRKLLRSFITSQVFTPSELKFWKNVYWFKC
jgi:hypothetical protein